MSIQNTRHPERSDRPPYFSWTSSGTGCSIFLASLKGWGIERKLDRTLIRATKAEPFASTLPHDQRSFIALVMDIVKGDRSPEHFTNPGSLQVTPKHPTIIHTFPSHTVFSTQQQGRSLNA